MCEDNVLDIWYDNDATFSYFLPKVIFFLSHLGIFGGAWGLFLYMN